MYLSQCKAKHNIPKATLGELNVHPYGQSWKTFLAHAEETWVMREELEVAEKAAKGFVYHIPSPSLSIRGTSRRRVLDTHSAQEDVPLQQATGPDAPKGIWKVNEEEWHSSQQRVERASSGRGRIASSGHQPDEDWQQSDVLVADQHSTDQ